VQPLIPSSAAMELVRRLRVWATFSMTDIAHPGLPESATPAKSWVDFHVFRNSGKKLYCMDPDRLPRSTPERSHNLHP